MQENQGQRGLEFKLQRRKNKWKSIFWILLQAPPLQSSRKKGTRALIPAMQKMVELLQEEKPYKGCHLGAANEEFQPCHSTGTLGI